MKNSPIHIGLSLVSIPIKENYCNALNHRRRMNTREANHYVPVGLYYLFHLLVLSFIDVDSA